MTASIESVTEVKILWFYADLIPEVISLRKKIDLADTTPLINRRGSWIKDWQIKNWTDWWDDFNLTRNKLTRIKSIDARVSQNRMCLERWLGYRVIEKKRGDWAFSPCIWLANPWLSVCKVLILVIASHWSNDPIDCYRFKEQRDLKEKRVERCQRLDSSSWLQCLLYRSL